VSSSKEGGASADAGAEAVDEDAVDMEENDGTIGGTNGKMLRNVFQSFRVNTQSHQNDQRQAPDSNEARSNVSNRNVH